MTKTIVASRPGKLVIDSLNKGDRVTLQIPFYGEGVLKKYGDDQFSLIGRRFAYHLNECDMASQLKYLMRAERAS